MKKGKKRRMTLKVSNSLRNSAKNLLRKRRLKVKRFNKLERAKNLKKKKRREN